MKENQKSVPLQKKKPERVYSLSGMAGKINLFRNFLILNLVRHVVDTAETEG